MPTVFSHALVAVSIVTAVRPRVMPKRFWMAGVACSILPDADVVGFGFGIDYGDLLGHRGLTHSLPFAAAMAIVAALAFVGRSLPAPPRWTVWSYLFAVTASHGLLDAMTDGGLGVAFWSPLSNARYFLGWRPIAVSPIGLFSFFTERGLRVLRSEVMWIWIPAALFALGALAVRRGRTRFSD